MNVKLGGGVPGGMLVDCDGEVEIYFLVNGTSG